MCGALGREDDLDLLLLARIKKHVYAAAVRLAIQRVFQPKYLGRAVLSRL